MIAKTAATLPNDAHWIGYASPSGMLQFFRQMMAGIAPNTFNVPEFPDTPPIGLSGTLTAGSLETDLALPGELLDATGKYVRQLQGQ